MAHEKRVTDECGEAQCMNTSAFEQSPQANYLRMKASEMRKDAGRQMVAASELEELADFLQFHAPLPQDIVKIIMNHVRK